MPFTSHRISVGLEQGPDGAVLAHALNLPGCVAMGPTPEAAMDAFAAELQHWLRLLADAGEPVAPPTAEVELTVDEWLRTDADVAARESDVCFAADLAALTDAEIDRALRLLGTLRGRLLRRVKALPPAALDAESPAGWTVRQILEELARATWWALSRLGASPMAEPPDSTLGRLDTAMALTVQHFAHLPPERRAARLQLDGEEWTPRKVLRRLLWQEHALGQSALSALEPIN